MTRSSLLLFFALAAGVRESAAGYTFRRSYDGPDDERAVGVVPMPDGGFLVVGTAEAVPDYRGVMLVRTDSFGQRLWTRAVPESTAEVRVHGFCARGPDTILAVGDVKSTRIDRDMYVA
ncbi:hypothetical protein FJY71_03025, partial [candidate division WOR-3 bacterium]|nr:hypothetical protein [candidate division WOR-3 bacterium]